MNDSNTNRVDARSGGFYGSTLMNSHSTMIHARCPFQPVWDYYTVTMTLRHSQFLRTEAFEAHCEEVRGITATQEEVATQLYAAAKKSNEWAAIKIEVRGRHGSNCETVCVRGDL